MNKTTSMQTETQHKLAEKEINSSILISAGCGAIPVSYIDIAATITTQMRMVKNLCDIYEVKWDEHIMKGLLSSVLGNIGKRMGASMLKSIPIIGPIAGGFTNAILSGVSTYAIGHAFIKYIQLNSSIKSVKDIDVKAFTSIYDDFNKKASSVAQMIKDKLRGVGGTPNDTEKAPKQEDSESVVKYGERIFGAKEKFHSWLNKANPLIEGKKPIELLLSTEASDHEKVRRLIQIHAESKTKAKA